MKRIKLDFLRRLDQSIFMSDLLKKFPWATYGRREINTEFFNKCKEQKDLLRLFPKKPLVSLVLLNFEKTPLSLFRETLESLQLQSYPYWEAWILSPTPPDKFIDDPRLNWLQTNDINSV